MVQTQPLKYKARWLVNSSKYRPSADGGNAVGQYLQWVAHHAVDFSWDIVMMSSKQHPP